MKSDNDRLPLIAILRGIRPSEVEAIGRVLVEVGIEIIEVPLNSPDPFESVRILAESLDEKVLIGGGTVLTEEQARMVHDAGGELVVAPNTDKAVINEALKSGMTPMPGFSTATEAFCAIAAGATQLKLFPAKTCGVDHVRALRAVLPESVAIFAVGGVNATAMGEWVSAGVAGFGIGGDLYQPGDSAEKVRESAIRIVSEFRRISSSGSANE